MASADNMIKCYMNEHCKFNSENNIVVKCCGSCGKLFHDFWVILKCFELKIDLDSLICENTDIEVSVNKLLLDSNNISAFTTKSSKRKNPSVSPSQSPKRANNNSFRSSSGSKDHKC